MRLFNWRRWLDSVAGERRIPQGRARRVAPYWPRLERLEARVVPSWIAEGPAPSFNGQVNVPPNDEVAGAVQAIAPDPSNANILYIGSPNGGVWKTTNATAASPTWTPLTDSLPSLSIGNLSLDPTDATHQTLLAGIADFSSFAVGDDLVGMYLTTNGGTSWTQLNNANLQGQRFTGVAARGSILLGASNNGGLFRSTNGGASFTKISGTAGLPTGGIFDLVGDPGVATRFYAGVGGKGVFRSDDSGATWTDVTAGITGISGTNDNIKIAVHNSPGNDVVYVAVDAASKLTGLFRSPDQGATWTSLDVPAVNGSSPQGSIHSAVAADPTNPNIVYVGGDAIPVGPFTGNIWRVDASKAAGSQAVSIVDSNAGNTTPHADTRRLVVDPNGNLLLGCDGGIYRRAQPTSNSGTWGSVNGNLEIMEAHDIAYNSISHSSLIGVQDNGTHQQPANGGLVWSMIFGGDGGDVAVDNITNAASGQAIRYYSAQTLLGFTRDVIDSSNNVVSSTPINVSSIGDPQFATPIELNAIDPRRLLIDGTTNVYESPDQGNTINSLGAVGPFAPDQSAIVYGGISGGVANPDLIYIGRGNQVFKRTTAGGTLAATSALSGAGLITDVTVDPKEWKTVFATDNNHVFMSIDAGTTWTNVTGNLLSISSDLVETIACVPSPLGDAVAIGSRSGVFFAKVAAPTIWNKLSSGMPDVIVYDLVYNATDDVLVAGTLGRGAWELKNASNFGGPTDVVINMTAAFNDVTLRVDPANSNQMQVLSGSTVVNAFALPLNSIKVNGDPGADRLTLDFSNGNFLPASGLDYTGGGGADTLREVGNGNNSWVVTAPNTGTVNGNVRFTGVGSLLGPTGNNTFTIQAGASLSGTIDGGNVGTLDFSAVTVAANVVLTSTGALNGFNGTAVPVVAVFQNIGNLQAGSANNALTALNITNAWTVAGHNFVFLNGSAFTNFATLNGGSGTDTFVINGGTLDGSINGGGGTNSLTGDNVPNTWTITGTNAGTVTGVKLGFSNIANLFGGPNSDFFQLAGGSLTGSLDGGLGANTLQGNNATNNWIVTAPNTGTVAGIAGGFSRIGSLIGGTQTDTFHLQGGTLTGSVTGGGGNDTFFADNVPNTWTITAQNTGQVTGIVGTFNGVANLVGGTQSDTFRLSTGTVTGSINGNGGSDMLIGADTANTWTLTGTDAGTLTGVNSFQNIGSLVGGAGSDNFQLAAGTLSGSITGGGGSNTIVGGNVANTWTVTNPDAGTVTGVAGGFVTIGNLTGGTQSDVFQLKGGTLSGAVAGGGGSDTLIGDDVTNTWVVTGANAGTVTGVSGGFSGIGNLTGGAKNDTFTLAGGTLTGAIQGGQGLNSLTGGNTTNTWVVTGTDAGTVTGVGGGFSQIGTLTGGTQNDSFRLGGGTLSGSVTGGGGTDTLTGGNVANTWSLTGLDAGTVTGIAGGFSGIANLVGGNANDLFQLGGGSLSGSVAGGGGNDTLVAGNSANTWVINGANAGTVTGVGGGFMSIANLTGGSSVDTFTLAGGSLTGGINGGGGNDSLTAGNVANTWTITGPDTGKVTGIGASFAGIPNLIGGTQNDSFTIQGGLVSGSITGGGGTDTLTAANTANVWAITGANSGTVTAVAGFSSITNLVGGTNSDLFQLQGGTLSGSIAGGGGSDTLVGGNTANTWNITGPNAGTVTGVGGGFTGIANLTGNAGGDNFTIAAGSVSGTITGGSGNANLLLDFTASVPTASVTFVGGSGASSLTAQGGNFTNETATLNGPKGGTLTLDALTVTYANLTSLLDTSMATNMAVNGSGNSETFNVVDGPNTGVQTTEINGAGAFLPLDVANKKNLAVTGGGGNDNFTLDLLTPAVGLNSVALTGGAGTDIFNVTPSPTLPYTVNGGANPTAGDTLTLSLAGVTSPVLVDTFSPATGFTGTWTFGNRQTISFSNIGTLIPSATLKLTVTAAATVDEGANLTYNFSVLNQGPSDAQNVILTLPVPTGATFGSFSSSKPATYNQNTGQANLGTIVAGASVTGSLVVQAIDEGSLTETASAVANTANPLPTNGTQTVQTPVLDAPLVGAPANISPTEGAAFTGTVATFTDANPLAPESDFTASIVWGDGHTTSGSVAATGSGAFTVSGTNTYADEGSYSLKVTITDKGGSTATVNNTVTVKDAALTAVAKTISTTEGVAVSGVVATFTDANPNAPVSDFTAAIAWGDGSTTPGVVAAAATGFSVSGSHVYSEAGNFTFQVTINDKGGSTVQVQGPAVSADVPMTAQAVNIQASVNRTFTGGVATFTDSSTVDTAGSFAATIDWGDGSSSTGVITGGGGSYSVNGTHIYGFAGNYTTHVAITEPGGLGDGANVFGAVAVSGIPHSPVSLMVIGADAGGGPNVQVYDGFTQQLKFSFFAYNQDFTGGVRVAVGDVNNDGTPDVITGAGPGGGPNVRVFDGGTGAQLSGSLGNFMAFNPAFTGGIYVAAGDVNGDGFADIIIGADAGGGPNITVFSGADGSRLASFFPYDMRFTGGVRVGAGDINGDGRADVLAAAGVGGGANVLAFSGADGSVLQNFTAFQNFTNGIYVAAGDINGDGRADIIVGKGKGGSPDVAVFDGVSGSQLLLFSAYDPRFSGGVRVAGVVTSPNGNAQILTGAGPGGGPDVRIYDSVTALQLDQFFAYDKQFNSGVFTAAGN